MSEQQGGGEQAAFAAGVAAATAQQASEEAEEASAGAEAAQETASVAVQEAVSASETAWAARSDVDGLAARLDGLEAKLTAPPEPEGEDRAPKPVEPKPAAPPAPSPDGGGEGGGKGPKKKKKGWWVSKTVTHWEIHYMPAHAGYLQVDMLDDRDKDVQVDTSGAGSLEIRMPHPFERSQRVIKSIPWHRVNYVQRVEREVPDSA